MSEAVEVMKDIIEKQLRPNPYLMKADLLALLRLIVEELERQDEGIARLDSLVRYS